MKKFLYRKMTGCVVLFEETGRRTMISYAEFEVFKRYAERFKLATFSPYQLPVEPK